MHRLRFAYRRLPCLVAACVAGACAQAECAVAESSPYEARVISAGAAVHSGPGENFYPTDTLAQGDVVEVYREKPGGWLAIRPPANSFSWVSGRDLKLRDGGVAEVESDDVASRIGSRLNDRHNAVQVRLKKGEVVEVLDEQNIGGEKWYKIAPPAGEFRWIQASLVERNGSVKTAAAEVTSGSSPSSTEPKKDPATTTAAAIEPLTSDSPPPPLISNTPIPTPSASAAPSAAATASPTAAANPTAASRPAAGPVADDLSRELTAIELRLSRMVAAPTNLWNTERLERDTAQLLARAQSPAERDAVRITMDKINRFAEIGRRHDQSPAIVAQTGLPPAVPPSPDHVTPPTDGLPQVAGSGDPRTVMGSMAANAGGGPYDAVGILRPVVSRRPGAPQFALVDERGQVLTFVTPTPDMNLQPYLGHRVGVVGNRGFIAEFNRAHVTAARVQPLNDRLVR